MKKELFIRLLSERRFKELKEDLMTMKAVDIASLLSQLDDKEIAIVFRLVPKDKAAEVFSNMNSSMQSTLVEIFSEKDTMERLHTLSCCYAVHKRQSAGVLERRFIIKNCFSLMNTAE